MKTKAYKTIKIYKALTGKNKEKLIHHKTHLRVRLHRLDTNHINHLQIVQNQITTGHTADTNNNIVSNEAKLMPIEPHPAIHSSFLRNVSTNPDHLLHKLLHNLSPPRMMRKSIYNNTENLIMLHITHHNTDQKTHRTQAKKTIHSQAVQQLLLVIPDSSILNRPPPDIDKTKDELPRQTRRLLA